MTGPRTRRNPLLGGKNELAGAPIEGNSTSAISCASIFAPILAPALASGPPKRYTDKNLQRATKLALELFVKGQKHGQANSAPRNKGLKAWNPNFYYKSSHMECYYFCQQYKDHFDTAGAMGHKRVLFTALFLQDRINFRWQQHKMQIESENAIPPTWDKFKAFF